MAEQIICPIELKSWKISIASHHFSDSSLISFFKMKDKGSWMSEPGSYIIRLLMQVKINFEIVLRLLD